MHSTIPSTLYWSPLPCLLAIHIHLSGSACSFHQSSHWLGDLFSCLCFISTFIQIPKIVYEEWNCLEDMRDQWEVIESRQDNTQCEGQYDQHIGMSEKFYWSSDSSEQLSINLIILFIVYSARSMPLVLFFLFYDYKCYLWSIDLFQWNMELFWFSIFKRVISTECSPNIIFGKFWNWNKVLASSYLWV